MPQRLIIFVFFCFISFGSFGQVDTEFWFAPPEITQGHGDRPIYLRLSTLEESASVQIYIPARQSGPIYSKTISANSTANIDLSNFTEIIETKPSDRVLKSGIRVVSSAPITAYYEVSSTWNVDIFVLKGKNSLGNNFIIPAQNIYDNGSYAPQPSFSFDIVATRDNTVVYITPTNPIVGHDANEKFLVKLNKGETYSAQRVSSSSNFHLSGSEVISNKPIAITLKDDSVFGPGGGCRDLLGDQLVPIKVAGKEYVALKGFLDAGEWIFITGIEDDTKVFVAGSTTPTTTINRGELYRYPLSTSSTHVLANKPIYVIHVTGFGCEAGMALLPSVNCRGSAQIGFTRSTSEFFGLNILVRKEGIGNFTLNGSTATVSSSSFQPVPGTSDNWYAGQISFQNTSGGVPVGLASLISNSSHSFQIGVINGGATSSCRYGYFSSFATLFIGDDLALCPLETARLDAGPQKDDYIWSDGSTGQYLDVSLPGKYWVNTTKENCVLSDTVTVEIKAATLDLGPDQTFCVGDTIIIDGKENFSWLWSDGSTEQFLATTIPGTYNLEISNFTGCVASDDIIVSNIETPTVELGDSVLKCTNAELLLDASYPGASYEWNTGRTSNNILAIDSGDYAVRVTIPNGCFAQDTLNIKLLAGPEQDSIYGSPSVCPFVTAVDYYSDTVSGSTFKWEVIGGLIASKEQDSIKVDWNDTNASAKVKLTVTNNLGCEGDEIIFPVKINPVLDVIKPLGSDTVCYNLRDDNLYEVGFTNGSMYDWQVTGGTVAAGQGTSSVRINWNDVGNYSLFVNESSTTMQEICDGTSETLPVFVFRDTTALMMDYISVENKSVFVKWQTNDPSRVIDSILHLTRWQSGEIFNDWTIPITSDKSFYFDISANVFSNAYDYQLVTTNLCFEPIQTNVHSSLLLEYEKDSLKGELILSWTEYAGWDEGVDRYDLYRSKDDGQSALIQSFDSSMDGFVLNATDGFKHDLRILAVSSNGNESWSNHIETEFEHPINLIPNIITPNGDSYNENFHISKILLYPESELSIFDRWGRSVFQTTGYDNSWDGDNLSSGTYFYFLEIPERGEQFKGSLTIVR